jgi:HEPN domain-containing protein
MERETPAYHTICFLCRESAEKFLKAYLISKGWELKKTHDIVELLEYCSDYDKRFDILVEDGTILNDYTADGRYPGDIAFEVIGLKQAKEAIEKAEQIKEFVIQKI